MTRHPDRPFNSWDLLKVIALLLMFVDHLGAYFLLDEQWLRSIGRGAAPIFLFLAGYATSYRFSWDLFILGCLMALSNIVMGIYTNPLSILFTILLCRMVLATLEKREKVIERPWEWFLSLTAFSFITCFITQYGTLGMMLAVSGYMERRPQRYALRTRRWFLIATLIVYGGNFLLLFGLAPHNVALMAVVLAGNYWLLSRFSVHPVDMSRVPAWLTRLLTLSSHYSGYIYAIHLIIISWITQYPL